VGLHPIRHRNHGVGGVERTQRTRDLLPVSEIFLSVQGEGLHSGTPSVFLRTYFCNLTCTWCDTKYTWLKQNESKAGMDYNFMTVGEALERIMSYGCRHLVLTGGEPLLHQEALAPLLSSLDRVDFYIEVETNGTIAPSAEVIGSVGCFNVSPKTSNSLVDESVRVRGDALKALVESRKAWFKFVVCGTQDLDEIEAMIIKHSIPRDRVFLMPEGVDAATILSRSQWLVRACMKRGLRFSPRLHILLFGNVRGT